jgi:hypothetical protein
MCRAAGFEFAAMPFALDIVVAWRRVLLATENYCALSDNLAEPERQSPAF